MASAKHLFGLYGFAATTVDGIAAAAGVGKGTVYHHFATKEAIFEAVVDEVSAELAQDVVRESSAAKDALSAIISGTELYFTAATRGATGRIVLTDGPVVLGWERWRAIDLRHFGGLFPEALERAMEAGLIARQPVEPLASLLLGAVSEAAAACAASTDPPATALRFGRALTTLLDGLRITPRSSHDSSIASQS